MDGSASDGIGADEQAVLARPQVAPTVGWRSVRLPADHYVRLDGNDYSVHPAVIGRQLKVSADLVWVRLLCDGLLVADHKWCGQLQNAGHRRARWKDANDAE